jgi:hypothetical protein
VVVVLKTSAGIQSQNSNSNTNTNVNVTAPSVQEITLAEPLDV